MTRPWIAPVLIAGVVLVMATVLVSHFYVFFQEPEHQCGPDGLPIRLEAGYICYSPAPTLAFYNGTTVVHCTEAAPEEDCFVYEVLTPEERTAWEERQNETSHDGGGRL